MLHSKHAGQLMACFFPAGSILIDLTRFAPLAVVLGAVAVATNPVFVRLSELTSVASAAHRMIWALPVFALWFWWSRPKTTVQPPSAVKPPSAKHVPLLLLCGLLFAVDLVSLHASIERTAAANSMLFVNAQPIYVVIGSWLLFGTRVTRHFGFGVAIALIGGVLVAWQSLDIGTEHLIGDGLGVLAGILYAGYILGASRLRGQLSSAEINLWTCLIAVPILVLVTLASGNSLIPETPRGWGLMIALGVISQGIGQGLIVWGLAHLPTSFSSVALLTAPVAAAVFAWLFLDESLSSIQIVGMSAVLVGIYVAWRAAPIASKKKPL